MANSRKKTQKTKVRIRKLIIPLAGEGTRLLPVTKSYPKEMIHLVDKPVIQYLVEEAKQSGIDEIIFVLSPTKGLVQKYFSTVRSDLSRKHESLTVLNGLIKEMKFHYIKKGHTRGDGHSIHHTRSKIGKDEVFAVSMGDLLSPTEKPFLAQLIQVYQDVKAPIISVQRVQKEEASKYGVVVPTKSRGRLHTVSELVEKPKTPPSNLIMTGKYILTPAVFPYIEKILKKKNWMGEVRLADALREYAKENTLYAYECEGTIQDTGNKLDFLKSKVFFALRNPNYKKALQTYLNSLKLSK